MGMLSLNQCKCKECFNIYLITLMKQKSRSEDISFHPYIFRTEASSTPRFSTRDLESEGNVNCPYGISPIKTIESLKGINAKQHSKRLSTEISSLTPRETSTFAQSGSLLEQSKHFYPKRILCYQATSSPNNNQDRLNANPSKQNNKFHSNLSFAKQRLEIQTRRHLTMTFLNQIPINKITNSGNVFPIIETLPTPHRANSSVQFKNSAFRFSLPKTRFKKQQTEELGILFYKKKEEIEKKYMKILKNLDAEEASEIKLIVEKLSQQKNAIPPDKLHELITNVRDEYERIKNLLLNQKIIEQEDLITQFKDSSNFPN